MMPKPKPRCIECDRPSDVLVCWRCYGGGKIPKWDEMPSAHHRRNGQPVYCPASEEAMTSEVTATALRANKVADPPR